MPLQYYQLTVAWSNAVLTAMLPHFSDCAKQLNLPIPTPITISQVARFMPPIETGAFETVLWTTNGYGFFYFNGALSFRSRDDLFIQEDTDHLERLVGKDNMTTNEAIDLARNSFVKLGYKLSDFEMGDPPNEIEGPSDIKDIGHMPFCRVTWRGPKGGTNKQKTYELQFDVDMQQKRLAGMNLLGKPLWRPVPKIDAVPEITNTPPVLPYFN